MRLSIKCAKQLLPRTAPLAACLLFAAALPATSWASDHQRYIQVEGQGYVEVMPDYLQFSLSLSATDKSAERAFDKVDQQMKQLLNTTKRFKIADSDIDAAQIFSQPKYEWRSYSSGGNKREYIGEEVRRPVTIELRDFKLYSQLARALSGIEGIEMHGSQMRFDDRQQWQDQAFALAVANAKRTANAMANASDDSLGDVISMQQGSGYAHQPMLEMRAMSMADSPMHKSAPAPMLIQKQRIEGSVSVRFALED